MTLYELYRETEFEDLWQVLQQAYELPDKAMSAYRNAYDELCALSPTASKKTGTLVVAKLLDTIEENAYVFDVFVKHPGDEERYALSLSPWEEWIAYPVHGKSVELYGAAAVLAHILYDMTFWGYSQKDYNKKCAEVHEDLHQAEIEAAEGKTIPAEEVFRKLGYVDERTEDEKVRQNKYIERALKENECFLRDLLKELP